MVGLLISAAMRGQSAIVSLGKIASIFLRRGAENLGKQLTQQNVKAVASSNATMRLSVRDKGSGLLNAAGTTIRRQ